MDRVGAVSDRHIGDQDTDVPEPAIDSALLPALFDKDMSVIYNPNS